MKGYTCCGHDDDDDDTVITYYRILRSKKDKGLIDKRGKNQVFDYENK
jgi:hypothetical protein